jgi:hypothetical protein
MKAGFLPQTDADERRREPPAKYFQVSNLPKLREGLKFYSETLLVSFCETMAFRDMPALAASMARARCRGKVRDAPHI